MSKPQRAPLGGPGDLQAPGTPGDRPLAFMAHKGRAEPRWWRQDDDATGDWHSDARPGPGSGVDVTHEGIALYAVPSLMGPAEARWLAARILEGVGVYEATFAGDGSRLKEPPAQQYTALPPTGPDPLELHLRTVSLESILAEIEEYNDDAAED